MNPAPNPASNQPPPLADYNLFTSDAVLTAAVNRECAAWARPQLEEFGRILGLEETIRLGFQANENPPVRNRGDEVEFHPAWHELMRLAIDNRIHNLPWADSRRGAHVARAALLYLASQNEAGHTCPVSMTYACVPALRKQPDAASAWEPLLLSNTYDRRFLPSGGKKGVLIGMSMTERQGGSDVRANTTRAEPAGSAGEYVINGEKWFCSAPMCDAFLILAQAPGGLTCFLLPRWTPDSKRNGFRIQRLKDKLGNRSNASAEVAFENAWARRIGEEGRGVATIIGMVQHTRLDCAVGSAAGMRQALVQALYHARRRRAFGKVLVEHALMRNVLADLALEVEAATLLAMRVARAFDNGEHAFARLATPVAKYWLGKRAPAVTAEAMECLGGNGYIEESVMPRLYREAPLNSIWEGCGNLICLDILRAVSKEPASVDAILDEARQARAGDRRFDAFLDRTASALSRADESNARVIAENLALLLQASLMVRFSAPAAAAAFCATRLSGEGGRVFGTLPASADTEAILNR